MPERELTVASEGAELAATLTLPEGDVRGGIVPLHPASDGSRHQFLFQHLADVAGSLGVAVLRYDRRPPGTGDDVLLAVQADDALHVLRALRAQPEVGSVPLRLWGWSQGACPAPLAATRSREVSLLVLLAAGGVSPAEQMRYGTAEQLRHHGFDDADALRELAELRAALEGACRDGGRLAAAQATIDRTARGSPAGSSAGKPTTLRSPRGDLETGISPPPVQAPAVATSGPGETEAA